MNRLSPEPRVIPHRRSSVPTHSLGLFSASMSALLFVALVIGIVPAGQVIFTLFWAAILVAIAVVIWKVLVRR